MPRVTQHTKSNRGREYRCVAPNCTAESRVIKPGDRYYEWTRRNQAPSRQHVSCGYPRPTQLSSRKTAVIEESIGDAQNEIGAWDPAIPKNVSGEESYEIETDELDSILSAVAESARDVASEYEDGVSAMPDSLQSSPTAEAMNDVAQRLNDWADEIEDWASSASTSVDVPSPDSFDNEEAWRDALESAHSEVVEEIRGAAESALEDMPEYEG